MVFEIVQFYDTRGITKTPSRLGLLVGAYARDFLSEVTLYFNNANVNYCSVNIVHDHVIGSTTLYHNYEVYLRRTMYALYLTLAGS